MGVPKDYTGMKFGLLTAIELTDKRRKSNCIWICRCDCGNICEKVIADLRKAVKKGQTPSCGCLFSKHHAEAATHHGHARHPIQRIWAGMKQRCYSEKARSFPNYGGRGIKVCDRWLNDFEAFYQDMIDTWKPGLSLDRIDNDGDYSPENCRWVDTKTQCRNKRNNRLVNGMTVTEFAEKCGVDRGTIYARIRRGVPDELLGVPTGSLRRKKDAPVTKA